jgi:hypothetical protein
MAPGEYHFAWTSLWITSFCLSHVSLITEVAQCLPYNCSADTFSFGILLWEIMALKPAFGGGLTQKQYNDQVSIGGECPPMSTKWPLLAQQVMIEC